ncbi:histidine-rich glycoprotein [Cynocephalus volans]|uniref:histidine-rich glycoprotein n=1 Tax=Cynocephalus volans TaxID=110931 RepID=UPI002FC93AB3
MKALTVVLLLITLQYSCAVSPTDCDTAKPVAEKALDQINKRRRDGYIFQLLRVTDAHLDKQESATVYYLALDVKETDCPVLSRKHWDDCEPAVSRRPSDLVIGQCKVLAITHSPESLDLRVPDFNCTTSSVSSAVANTKDSSVVLDFFEDTKLYKKQADEALEKYKRENGDFTFFRVDQVERAARARGGERTNYYVDFSVRNCSSENFPRYRHVFGFCRADLSYDVGATDLETPEDIVVNCEVFNFEEHRNISGGWPFAGKSPFKPDGSRDHHHPPKPHEHGCPPPSAEDHPDRPTLNPGAPPPSPPPGLRCRHHPFVTNGIQGSPHNHTSSKNRSHEHHPHGHRPHGPPPFGHPPHGPPPHGPPPHGPPPFGHPPHGPPPHGPPPHGPPPHGPPPHGHKFHDYGPCDPPPHSQGPQDHHRHDHGPPPRHSKEKGPGKGHGPFHGRHTSYVYRLPPLKEGEVLPLPEANFPIFSLPSRRDPLKPEIQPFPQSASESCPGQFKSEFLQTSKFFAHTSAK